MGINDDAQNDLKEILDKLVVNPIKEEVGKNSNLDFEKGIKKDIQDILQWKRTFEVQMHKLLKNAVSDDEILGEILGDFTKSMGEEDYNSGIRHYVKIQIRNLCDKLSKNEENVLTVKEAVGGIKALDENTSNCLSSINAVCDTLSSIVDDSIANKARFLIPILSSTLESGSIIKIMQSSMTDLNGLLSETIINHLYVLEKRQKSLFMTLILMGGICGLALLSIVLLLVL